MKYRTCPFKVIQKKKRVNDLLIALVKILLSVGIISSVSFTITSSYPGMKISLAMD